MTFEEYFEQSIKPKLPLLRYVGDDAFKMAFENAFLAGQVHGLKYATKQIEESLNAETNTEHSTIVIPEQSSTSDSLG